MPVNQSEAPWPALRRASRTVVVVDVVESVRLMEQDEDDTIRRWQSFVGEVVTRLLPQHGGRLVKSLGDGLMLEFESVPPAIQCALAMQQAIQPYNHGRASDQWMCLRVGVHVADVVVDERDIYGSGVNLAARLATLASPGEVVISTEIRDTLVPGLEFAVADLGLCYLKNLNEPIRAYKVGAIGEAGPAEPGLRPDVSGVMPSIAVLPFISVAGGPGEEAAILGRVLANDLTAVLSCSEHWCVVSSLSTTALSNSSVTPERLHSALKVSYAVSGTVWMRGARLHVNIQLADAKTGNVVWAQVHTWKVEDVFDAGSNAVASLAAEISRSVLQRELKSPRQLALPNLPAHSLLLQAISSMHKLVPAEIRQARKVLDHLIDRHPQSADIRAWLAKWHFMQLPQFTATDPTDEISRARFQLRCALDRVPEHGLSLALEGQLLAYVERDLGSAEEHLRRALAHQPNEPLAWLFLANVLAARGEGAAAVVAAERAKARSPLDPMAYFFDGLAAIAYNADARFGEAEASARRSIEHNRLHLVAWTELIIAQVMAGRLHEARANARQYLAMRPQASVQAFLDRHPGDGNFIAKRDAHALREAGLPW